MDSSSTSTSTSTSTKVSDKQLRELKDIIGQLEEFQKVEIYKIIKNNEIKYTSNKNGVFINMKLITPKCIEDINNYLKFININ